MSADQLLQASRDFPPRPPQNALRHHEVPGRDQLAGLAPTIEVARLGGRVRTERGEVVIDRKSVV